MRILNSFGSRLSKIAVIYFVFQAKQVQIKLQAQTVEDFQTKIKKCHKIYLLIITLFICFVTLTFTYNVLKYSHVLQSYQDETQQIMENVDLVSIFCSDLIFIIVCTVFINFVVFYIQTRKKQQNTSSAARSNPIQVE